MGAARDNWEDTLRALGALLDAERVIARPAVAETADGLHVQALASGEPFAETLDEVRLEQIADRARQQRSGAGIPWTDLGLVGQRGDVMAAEDTAGRKNYEATLREVGRYIQRTGMRGFVLFETKHGYLLRGLVKKRRADGAGDVWDVDEVVWSNAELDRIASEAVRLRGTGGEQ